MLPPPEPSLRQRLREESFSCLSPPNVKLTRITVELTPRHESKHPPPNQSSYKTRSRRSRPTILLGAPCSQSSPSIAAGFSAISQLTTNAGIHRYWSLVSYRFPINT